MNFESIKNFGWDQSGNKVKVYVTSGVDGVGSLGKDQVVCEFEDKSFDLRIQGLNNKNYRLRIPEPQHEISLSECKFNVKKNGVSITLIKKNAKESWTDLKPKKSLVDKDKLQSNKKTGDPEKDTASAYGDLMGMMKDMYVNGDDQTKAKIAEAWQKS